MILDVPVDLDAGRSELREHGVEVGDGEVHHSLLVGRPVRRVGREGRPDGVSALREDDVTAVERDAEVLRVPRDEGLRIASPEEHAADPGRALHGAYASRARAIRSAARSVEMPSASARA